MSDVERTLRTRLLRLDPGPGGPAARLAGGAAAECTGPCPSRRGDRGFGPVTTCAPIESLMTAGHRASAEAAQAIRTRQSRATLAESEVARIPRDQIRDPVPRITLRSRARRRRDRRRPSGVRAARRFLRQRSGHRRPRQPRAALVVAARSGRALFRPRPRGTGRGLVPTAALPPDRPPRANGIHPRIDPRPAAAQFRPTADPHR